MYTHIHTYTPFSLPLLITKFARWQMGCRKDHNPCYFLYIYIYLYIHIYTSIDSIHSNFIHTHTYIKATCSESFDKNAVPQGPQPVPAHESSMHSDWEWPERRTTVLKVSSEPWSNHTVCVCVFACVYMYVCVCMWPQSKNHTVYVYVCVCVYIYIYIYTCVCVYMCSAEQPSSK